MWDKENILSLQQELNLWPPRHQLGALTTELRETRTQAGIMPLDQQAECNLMVEI